MPKAIYTFGNLKSFVLLVLLVVQIPHNVCGIRHYSKQRKLQLREQVQAMFQHAYDGYLRYATGYDELRPLTCDGVDTWGSYSLTLIDALDTLATMGNFTEFRRVAQQLEKTMDFDRDINVSVFETNIRIVGGLLSAHLLSKRAGVTLEEGWPCEGPLLRLAENVARRLLPAFETVTGMPYGTVNLRYGVPKGETAVTCTAGVGTFLVEFGTLSRLTGNPIFEEVALNAVHALWKRRSPIGLFGNHIDVQTGRWTATDSGIGAGVDSFFEYLVKGSMLLNRPELLQMFHEARAAIDKYLKREDWYVWVNMLKGHVTLPVFQSLEAFWPGVLSTIGDIRPAMRTLSRYSAVWRKYGFLPEFYNIPMGEAAPNRETYPLRPELAESLMFLYRATKNEFLLEMGENMVQSIEFSAKTRCGYATIRNVVTHEKENRMESFFLAETAKYLYLLFDEDNFLHDDGGSGEIVQTAYGECVANAGAHIFNTEAHPMDMSALYCCHSQKEDIFDGLDLEQFRGAALLIADRERHLATMTSNHDYQCTKQLAKTKKSRPEAPSKAQEETQFTVDIEVFDENDEPADEVLIDNFDRIKREEVGVGDDDDSDNENMFRNQLTVSDLEKVFTIRRHHFSSAEEILDYLVDFLHNYTLDASFIAGLQIFDRRLTAVLGSSAQKDFEGRLRTLWELYKLEQRNNVNADLVINLGIIKFDEGNMALLENILKALNQNPLDEASDDWDVLGYGMVVNAINMAQLAFEQALVNTTAMQQFLLKVMINGTMDRKRNAKTLLSPPEVAGLPTTRLDDAERTELFATVRKIVEFKKRMLETLAKLQSLMQESNKLAASATPALTKPPDSDRSSGSGYEEDQTQAVHNTSPKKWDNTTLTANSQVQRHVISDEPDDSSDSVWSQLIQTILRKATPQRHKFNEEQLLLKTRQSLQQHEYDYVLSHHQGFSYGSAEMYQAALQQLFTCQRPKFIDKFAYREFQP